MPALPTLFYEANRGARTASNLGLPADLLEKTRGRIRIVALLVLFASGLDVLIWVGQRIAIAFGDAPPLEATSRIPFSGSLMMFLVCAAMVVLTRTPRISNAQLLWAGLGLEVLLCATISLSNPIAVYQDQGSLPQLTWVTPLIILFPLIVPLAPHATLMTAVLAASTRPLGLWLLDSIGAIECRADDYVASSFGPAVAVVMAYFGSRIVHGLGLQVAEARRMGSYRLERVLGKGGMGEVWLARHRFLARPAAVKLIRPEILGLVGPGSGSARDRFEKEAQATASLRCSHTIQLYDYGVTESGALYYVMELLDGYDLELLVERFGPLPASRAIHLLLQICESLAEAHEAGLIHRDIKPANVYVCRYGREVDFVKILDFGLVKTVHGTETRTDITAEHAIPGTAAYLSPEQARGQRGDARSDLYALGCVAYWMLTGDLVFSGATPLEQLVQHARETPLPPSARVEMPIPAALERLVMQCLAKDPSERPVSALDLAHALSACARADPWPEEAARAWWKAHQPRAIVETPGAVIGTGAID